MSLKDLFTGSQRIISSGTGHTRSDWLNLKSNMGAHNGYTEIQGFNYIQSSGGKAKLGFFMIHESEIGLGIKASGHSNCN